jgi:hypothetical protein
MKRRLQLAAFALILSAFSSAGQTKDAPNAKARILAAKSIYFEDQISDAAVRDEALQQLKKWGRFQIVKDPKAADLIFLLSADPRKGGYLVFSGGQTGTVGKNGQIEEDEVPSYNKAAPVRYAYLTVYDVKTGANLWSAEHKWGGALTGFHSAGARLVNKLRKEIEK